MSKQKPESEDWFGENIENSVSNDLGINAKVSGTISKTPDAITNQHVPPRFHFTNLHWVHSPENQGEAGNGLEECPSLGILGHGHGTTVNSKLVDDHKVCQAGDGIVSPLGILAAAKSSKETGQNHDNVSNDGDEDVGSAQASKEGKVQEEERGGDTPVDIAGPVDLTVHNLVGVGDVLVTLLNDCLGKGDSITDSHSKVGNCGKGGDESSQDVEETFLLDWISMFGLDSEACRRPRTTGTRKAMA